MSMFLNPFNAQEVDERKLELAQVQFDAMSTSFNMMLRGCLEKCIPHEYGEADLNKGEMSCVDRCIAKIHYANRLVGGLTQARNVGPDHLRHYEHFKESK
ncbi:Mitochondrial import inner membrane translocase subunit TIM12 [Lachancea thermotolerans]|uniref:Mitochondrial import inner membrane translocase subunit n=1 Tax=Lachancea thermotolerans (strain ATCC 56472 / CBS 6340 / NRRL Y-8284) TaxID=559295 RepID=C5DIS8_LACTC|nr:KLTH0E14872p [Lachancea thermotolerans CBS 6340]CAR23689.1 KLTH0E14872p [Lachancea thermotolerans CBS 6340]